MNKRCAVIIAAYNSEKYILDTLDALFSQEVPDGWQLDFYIGVDGCNKTFKVLKSKKIGFYYSPKNAGTYVMANSLIKLAEHAGYDAIARFDSDDIPKDNYFINGLRLLDRYGYVRSVVLPLDKSVRSHGPFYSNGQFFISKDVWSIVGGFDDYRVSGDHALMLKMQANGYPGLSNLSIDVESMPVVFKRWHDLSITSNTSDDERSLIHKQIDDKIEGKDFFVNNPKTVELIKHLSSTH